MKAIQSQVLWRGASWRLLVNSVLLPDGSTVERGSIEHPGAVVLVPLRYLDGVPEVLMVRQHRLAIDEMLLELPAGTRGWDETWQHCAQRELREETGFRAEKLLSLGDAWAAPGISSERLRFYLATELTADPLPHDVDELIEVQPMDLIELKAMAMDGRLLDAKSIIGILKTAHHLEQGG